MLLFDLIGDLLPVDLLFVYLAVFFVEQLTLAGDALLERELLNEREVGLDGRKRLVADQTHALSEVHLEHVVLAEHVGKEGQLGGGGGLVVVRQTVLDQTFRLVDVAPRFGHMPLQLALGYVKGRAEIEAVLAERDDYVVRILLTVLHMRATHILQIS